MLLISQTVIEGANQRCEKVDSIVNVAGSSFTKNGDAIKALYATGALQKLDVTVVMKREEA